MGRVESVVLSPSVFAEAASKEGLAARIRVHPLQGIPATRNGMYVVAANLPKKDVTTLVEGMRALNNEGEYGRLYRQAYHDMPAWTVSGFRDDTTK